MGCHESISVIDKYALPKGDTLILDDGNTGVVIVGDNTWTMSKEALDFLWQFIGGKIPQTVGQTLKRKNLGDIDLHIRWVSDAGFMQLTSTKPTLDPIIKKEVKAGGVVDFKGFEKTRITEDGVWLTRTIRLADESSIKLNRFSAKERLCDAPILDAPISLTRSPGQLTAMISPRPVSTSPGANCNVCAACASCGACGACVLCGGWNFAVAMLFTVAVDASLAVVHASASALALRTEAEISQAPKIGRTAKKKTTRKRKKSKQTKRGKK